VRSLQAVGVDAVAIPLITINELAEGVDELASALERAQDYSWVAVTSANGARALAAARGKVAGQPALGRPPALGRIPTLPRIAAVGSATAAALAELGLAAELMAATPTAGALAEAIIATAVAGTAEGAPVNGLAPVLFVTSRQGRRTLETVLAEHDVGVRRIEVYSTDPTRVTDAQRRSLETADVVVAFSPSAVAAIAGLGVAPACVVCAGPTTAAAANDALGTTSEVIELGEPSDAAVVEAVRHLAG
jgi:uroporphyrinogen-III synthase